MTEGQEAKSNITQLKPTAGSAQKLVRSLAADSSKIRWTQHVVERMAERGIDSTDVLNILTKGDVDDAPDATEKEGEFTLKITKKLSSGRVAGVVLVLIPKSKKIRLLTAEWEDVT
jgi:hypothetical protein